MRISGGLLGGRRLKTASNNAYRPATSKVRQAVMSMLQARGMLFEGASMLDLYAGTGSLGFESVSRGASLAVFVEHDRQLCRLIQENALHLGLRPETVQVRCIDVESFMRQKPLSPFDLICIDPPYGRDLLRPVLKAVANGVWLQAGGMVVVEAEANLTLDAASAAAPLELLTDRLYGQTRICIWRNQVSAAGN